DEIGQLSKLLHRAMKERLQVETANAGLMRKMSSVMVAAPIGIAFTATQRLELVSHEFAALLGHEVVTLSGRPARDIFASDDDYDGLGPKVADAFSAGQPFFDEMQFRRRDGSLFWGRLQGRPVDSDDAAAGTIWLLEDVTAHRLERERLSWSASHDALTRLLNRAAFDAELEGLITRHGAALPAALLFIDLDHFKAINDSAGHAAGDQVLKAVAALLESKVRGADCVARIGGDEFAILLRQCDRSVALRIAEQVRSGAARIGIDHQGQRLQIGASIGVVAVVTPPLSVAELLARADAACYEAKRGGRDAVRLAEEPDAGVLRTDECAPG
ncbi:MAG: sensor domain-containing diguanylate cyclase, partial [Rubrivivax sp.]|nr:sensor domain-containing diguanylate cyclase [Rubrivivax sp.]